jgi:hypothetical protein
MELQMDIAAKGIDLGSLKVMFDHLSTSNLMTTALLPPKKQIAHLGNIVELL